MLDGGAVLPGCVCQVALLISTTPTMLARVNGVPDERIGRALAVAAYLLRERRDSRAVDGGEGL